MSVANRGNMTDYKLVVVGGILNIKILLLPIAFKHEMGHNLVQINPLLCLRDCK